MIHVTSTIVSDAGFAVYDCTSSDRNPQGRASEWLRRHAIAFEESGDYRLALVEATPMTLRCLPRYRLVDQASDFGDDQHGRFRIFMAPDDASNGNGGPWYLVALDDAARERADAQGRRCSLAF
jgi:hypothetical protein